MKTLTITHVSPSCVVVSGHGSRDLVMKVMTRAPVFASGNSEGAPRGWVMQPHRVPDLIAVSEARGWTVLLDEASKNLAGRTSVPVVAATSPETPESVDPGRGLW